MLPEPVPPFSERRETAARHPVAAERLWPRVIDFYLRESFGGPALENEI